MAHDGECADVPIARNPRPRPQPAARPPHRDELRTCSRLISSYVTGTLSRTLALAAASARARSSLVSSRVASTTSLPLVAFVTDADTVTDNCSSFDNAPLSTNNAVLMLAVDFFAVADFGGISLTDDN